MGQPARQPKEKIKLTAAVDPGGAFGVDIRCKCGHRAELDIAELIGKMGPDATFSDVERLAKCVCGKKGGMEARPIYVRPTMARKN